MMNAKLVRRRKVNRRKDVPDLIVSVESRKGGVGKTTAALCLSRILRNRSYSVLVLDLDVTGTNAADIGDSPFWTDDLHIVQKPARAGTATEPLNLIELFDRCFMAGRAVPDFSTQDSSLELLRVDLRSIRRVETPTKTPD
jgi:cellulose biosynthesis protein BcsQ